MTQMVFRCFAMVCLAFAATAFAQRPEAAGPRPPVSEATPSSVYRSAWSGYRPFADEKSIAWKEANDEVRRIGGWRAYRRESQEHPSGGAGAAGTVPSAQAPKPAPDAAGATQGHDAHSKPKESR